MNANVSATRLRVPRTFIAGQRSGMSQNFEITNCFFHHIPSFARLHRFFDIHYQRTRNVGFGCLPCAIHLLETSLSRARVEGEACDSAPAWSRRGFLGETANFAMNPCFGGEEVATASFSFSCLGLLVGDRESSGAERFPRSSRWRFSIIRLISVWKHCTHLEM